MKSLKKRRRMLLQLFVLCQVCYVNCMLHDTLRRQFSYAYFEEKNIVTTVFF